MRPWLATATPTETRTLVKMYEDGATGPAIAEQFGIAPSTVYIALRSLGATVRREFKCEKTCTVDHAAFDDPTREEVQYFTGLLMADGCITTPKDQPNPRVHLLLKSQDEEMVLRFRDFLKCNHKVYRRKPGINANGYRCSGAVHFSVTSRPIADKLAKFGVLPRKTMTARLRGGMEHNRHVFRGLLDGDGTITQGRDGLPTVALTGSQPVVEQFVSYTKGLCPFYKGSPHTYGKNAWVASCSGSVAVELLRHLYGDCTVALARKKILADQAMAFREIAGHAPVDEEERQGMVSFYLRGDLILKIAEEFGRTPKTVTDSLKKAGVYKKDRGLRHPKLDRILSLHDSGWTPERIGQDVGLNQATVRYHINRHRP